MDEGVHVTFLSKKRKKTIGGMCVGLRKFLSQIFFSPPLLLQQAGVLVVDWDDTGRALQILGSTETYERQVGRVGKIPSWRWSDVGIGVVWEPQFPRCVVGFLAKVDLIKRNSRDLERWDPPFPYIFPYQSYKKPLKYGNGMRSGHGKGVPRPWRNPAWTSVKVQLRGIFVRSLVRHCREALA